MKFWDFFKVHTHPIEERDNYAVLVVRIPISQISRLESLEYLDDRNVSKSFIVGEALDEYLRKRLFATTETENHIHFTRAPKKEIQMDKETIGMRQAKN
jgi:hypothetical protein